MRLSSSWTDAGKRAEATEYLIKGLWWKRGWDSTIKKNQYINLTSQLWRSELGCIFLVRWDKGVEEAEANTVSSCPCLNLLTNVAMSIYPLPLDNLQVIALDSANLWIMQATNNKWKSNFTLKEKSVDLCFLTKLMWSQYYPWTSYYSIIERQWIWHGHGKSNFTFFKNQ